MAKEANTSVEGDAGVERRRKKTKSHKKIGNGGGSTRPSYCPNKSKSFNASRSIHRNYHVSTSALKKNNDELAKSLNKCRGVIAQLHTEKLDFERQIMDVRAERPLIDEHAIEVEGCMNDCLNLVLLVKFRSTRRLIFLNDLSWNVVGILCEDNAPDDLIRVLGSEKHQ